ncbi:MAG: Flp family type IVb pilin [Alphaproteobacteria bacterium]|nr:Flp family type IVb pilin [Alphaproteobacteria bacterium]
MYASMVKQFATDKRGATAVEYAVGVAFIASAVLGLAGAVGTTIKAESYATILNGKVFLASSKKDLVRIAARSSSDPIQTGSTADAPESADDMVPRARKMKTRVSEASATPFCNSGDEVRPCRLDLTKQSFQGWRGTMVDWSPDSDEDDH